jgi:microcystin-dependent protein
MSTPFLSEIKIFSFGFPPKGWALCDGQLLPINQNQALFSLLGTTYGGDGRVNFSLPDLQARVPLHMGNGFTLGQRAGEQAHTLTTAEMPAHTHVPIANPGAASVGDPTGNTWANAGAANFTTDAPNNTMSLSTVSSVGGNQAHLNTPPFLVLSFCIALQGIFPSQN